MSSKSHKAAAAPVLDDFVEGYFRDGFLGPLPILADAEAASLRADVERIAATRGPAPDVTAAQASGRLLGKRRGGPGRANVECRHLDSPAILSACRAPALRRVLEPLYGPGLVLWRTTLIIKEGGGAEYAWHQDFGGVFGRGEPYGLEPPVHFSVWLAVTPADRENGCLRFIPTLNRVLPTVPANDSPDATLLVDPGAIDERRALDMPLRPGEGVIFTDRALHASHPNVTDRPRVGIAMRFTLPAVRVRPLFEGHRTVPAFE